MSHHGTEEGKKKWKVQIMYQNSTFQELWYPYDLQVTKARPNDKDARAKYQECNKIVKRLAFEKAIAVEETAKKCVSEQINLENMCKYTISTAIYI